MKRLILFIFFICAQGRLFAGSEFISNIKSFSDNYIKPYFGFDFLWSGAYENEGELRNRFNAVLTVPLGFSFRFQHLMSNKGLPWEWNESHAKNESGFAVYHKQTGSRILWGKLNTWGLAARTRNIWQHSTPWIENRRASGADIKTAITSSSTQDFYARLSTPELDAGLVSPALKNKFSIKLGAVAQLRENYKYFFEGSSSFTFFKKYKFNFEALFCEQELNERKQSSWFSEKPYLPARDTQFSAFSMNFQHRVFSFAADAAFSQVFALGEGSYISAALRAGSEPWRVSISIDSAGSRYTDNAGSLNGAGFRAGGKFEWFWKRNSRLEAASTVRAEKAGAPFDRSTSRLRYYFPTSKVFGLRPRSVTFGMEHDGVNPEAIKDNYNFSCSLTMGPLSSTFSFVYKELSSAEPGSPVFAYYNPGTEHVFEESKISAALSCRFLFITLKAGISCRKDAEDEVFWDKSLSVQAKLKFASLNIRVSDNQKNGALDYLISWKFQYSY